MSLANYLVPILLVLALITAFNGFIMLSMWTLVIGIGVILADILFVLRDVRSELEVER